MIRIPLHRSLASDTPREVLRTDALTATLFRTPHGIEGVRLANGRGEIVVLPWFGGMVWSVRFDGVDCTMGSGFDAPRPSETIGGTYGCFAFHSGLLRNGVPGPGDDHAPHGEFPCAPLQDAWLELADDGRALRLAGLREHVVGFGPRYRAEPSVTLAADAARAVIGMDVLNRGGRPMDLMYMAHVNWAYVPGGRIVQAAPFTPERTRVRRAVPAHVTPDAAYTARIDMLAAEPGRARVLDGSVAFDPEQVFYVHGLGTDARGETAAMLRRPAGDAFAMRWSPATLPHCVRWLFDDPDQQVAAFALPATCEPEGHAAERRKGNVRALAPGERARFAVTVAHLDATEADETEREIEAMGDGR